MYCDIRQYLAHQCYTHSCQPLLGVNLSPVFVNLYLKKKKLCCPIICADLRGTAPAPLVPAFPPSATPRAYSALQPRPQRSTGGDVKSLVGCHPKETLHCCWVTSVVFSSACSDSTYTGHHLLCPLLTTVLAKSQSQTEWASLQRADRRYVPPPIFLCELSDVEGFDQNCLKQGRK